MLLFCFVTFYSLCAVYLVFGVHNRRFIKCLLKCLPTFALLLFAVANLVSLQKNQSMQKKSRIMKLVWALTLSCIGDGCLVFPPVFFVGVLIFTVSLFLYINVLEVVDSIKYITYEGILTGVCIFFLAVVLVITITITSTRSRHFPKVPRMMVLLVLFYYFILSMLLWSGVMLFLRQRDLASVGAAVGVVMFYISDLLIAASAFWNLHLLQGRCLIMLTYYTAQLLLTLSIVFLH